MTGDYPLRFQWAAHSYGPPTAVGDPTALSAAAVPLWGGYVTDRSGGTRTALGADRQTTSATIRLRNSPAVNPLDTLTDPHSGEVWAVDTVRRGANELLAEVSR